MRSMTKYPIGVALMAVIVLGAGCAYNSTSGGYEIRSAIPVPQGFYQRLTCTLTNRC